MCITSRPAHLSKTLLYAAEVEHDGRIVHVLGYQNRAQSLSPGPNAMLLPLPSAEPMTASNILDTSHCPRILKDYAEALRPKLFSSKGASRGLTLGGPSVQVFDSGHYTVVLASQATAISTVLQLVKEERRPEISDDMLAAFEGLYPGWHIALCCFSDQEMPEPDPLLWWYVPKTQDLLFLPALDAHDGGPPKLDARVKVDHTIMVGTFRASQQVEKHQPQVRFSNRIPERIRPFLVPRISGLHGGSSGPLHKVEEDAGIKGRTLNGDFIIPTEAVRSQRSLDANSFRLPPSAYPQAA